MEKIVVKIAMPINVKVTGKYKAQLISQIEQAINRADLELGQLEFQGKRLIAEQLKVNPSGITVLREQINIEKQQRENFKNNLLKQLKEKSNLQIGSIVFHGNVERLIEVGVGDNLEEVMRQSILLEDGKIIFIGLQQEEI